MWSLLKSADGRRLLMNLDTVMGFGEDDNGQAVAVSIAGITVPLGTKLDEVILDYGGEDMLQQSQEQEVPGNYPQEQQGQE